MSYKQEVPSITIEGTRIDPQSAKQCSECKKDCLIKNIKGLCLTADIPGDSFNLSREVYQNEKN